MNKIQFTVGVHPTTGETITFSQNTGLYTARIDQFCSSINENGFAQPVKIAIFLKGNSAVEVQAAIDDIVLRREFRGKRVYSFKPFYTKANGTPQSPVVNPNTKAVALKDGRQYYSNVVLVPMNSNEPLVEWLTESNPVANAVVETHEQVAEVEQSAIA